jgi:dihydropteroate synthase
LKNKDTFFFKKKILNLHGRAIDLTYPAVMGILNITPDSFYDGGKHDTLEKVLKAAGDMLTSGALILDVGGYSSRPGAEDVPEEEEYNRVVPAIEAIKSKYPDAIISVDTFRSSIADAALKKGASLVNDISGGSLDEKMYSVVAEHKAVYVIMHMRGTPQNMHTQTGYNNILLELIEYFQNKIWKAINAGIIDIIIDPGFGFSKSMDENYELLKKLDEFKVLGYPLLAGISRKSMIYKRLGTTPEKALNGTTMLNAIALMNNVNLLRVHDVKEANEVITLYKTIYN